MRQGARKKLLGFIKNLLIFMNLPIKENISKHSNKNIKYFKIHTEMQIKELSKNREI